ncbi:sugar phosphate isomerase/epimerase [Chloroflexi bacterium TSY]|nr:sugar phosphate isomerase/epimerase [Chloroflexi bacterium TSY]
MQYIMFTKHLEGLDVSGIIAALKSVGVQGADLCVRTGYPVNPQNIETALPQAAKQFADEGLSIPLVTAPGDFNKPDIDYAERYYAACGEAGVKHIKLGYWHWHAGMDYWDQVERIRGYLADFQELSKKTGVQTVVHNHSGRSMGLNSGAAMRLVEGFDRQHIGIFTDPGHLSLCGEPIDMALNMVQDYLSILAFKDLIRERVIQNGELTWRTPVRRMGEGFVDWKTTLSALKKMKYEGAISFHSEYSGEPTETVIDLARADVRFINRVLSEIE